MMIPASWMAAVRRVIRDHTYEIETDGEYSNRQVDKY